MSLDLLDAAIGEVKEHRHSPPGDGDEPGDDVPDPFVFDPQTLGDLHDFLRDARRGVLTADEMAQEAQMWQQLVDVAWPHTRAGDSPVEQAVAMLAAVPGAVAPPVLAATEERFSALLPDGSEVSRVLAPGRDLPHGGRSELPHPRSVTIVAPGDHDEDRAVLLTAAAATVAGCKELAWACIRHREAPEHAPWRDVLVVTVTSGSDGSDGQAAVVQALDAALPVSVFPHAVVVGRDADLVHPLVEAVVAAGRSIRPL